MSQRDEKQEHNESQEYNEDKGTKLTVYAALLANLVIAISKFIAGGIAGSASLLAEGAHSVSDTVNQGLLLISFRSSQNKPDRNHPYGYGKDRFFWTLIVAGLFFITGAVFSSLEGVLKIITGEQSSEFLPAYIVLGASVVFEGGALIITIREFWQGARAHNRSFWGHFKTTRNTTIKVPLYEDTAALVGVVIAAAGLLLTQLIGSVIPDAIGSFAVGAVLVFVSWRLTIDSRALLLGEAVPPEHDQCLHEVINSFDEVKDILRLLTMQISPEAVLVTAEIHVVEGLETEEIEDLLERITQAMREEVPEVSQTFLELHEEGYVGQSVPKNS